MDQVKIFKGCLPQILLGPFLNTSQREITCFKLTIETLEQGVKYVQT